MQLKKRMQKFLSLYVLQHFKLTGSIDKSAWEELVKSDDNAVILDVRTPEECAEGMQENAVQMNYLDTQSFQQNIQKLDSSKTYYVYCGSGARSANACQMMKGIVV